jgi:arginyl-tRNA synthetase
MDDEARQSASGAETAGAIATPNGHVAVAVGEGRGPAAERVEAQAGGIVAREERRAAEAIAAAIAGLGLPARHVDLRPLPFEGTWGVASSVCFGLANDAVMADLAAAGALEGLSKKEAKRLAAEGRQGRVVSLAEDVAASVAAAGHGFAKVEAANGYVNVSFDANAMAARLIGEVLGRGRRTATGRPWPSG